MYDRYEIVEAEAAAANIQPCLQVLGFVFH